MNEAEWDERLSQIQTMWTVLRQAHAGAADAAAARELLIRRYGGAVHKYLLSVLRDPHAAEEVLQEFALALVKGQLHGADQGRGRFRAYVKVVLFHLVAKYRQREAKVPRPVPGDDPALAALPAAPEENEHQFLENWRYELLARAWEALATAQSTFHAVLRLRAANPKMPAPEMALELGRRLGRPFSADGVRQTLRRAREKFAELLLDEVAHSLEEPTRERVEEELADLNLLEYCRPALERRHGTG
jgi:RNA polymerase sigma-70 factor (ECF subfamily)